MGYLAEKYNSAYFLRKDGEGNNLNYGVEGVEEFLNGDLREHDKEILSHVNLSGANILEFGFGRGETIKHVWEAGASTYIGVDFSVAACEIATEFLEKFAIKGPQIICADAIEFIRAYVEQNKYSARPLIDVVIMLDFVEHVPRIELREILQALKAILSPEAVIVINTPDFAVDNDVIADGLDERGLDSSDVLEETRGMHCNRYTLGSLRRFLHDLGFQAISRGHYFVRISTSFQDDPKQGEESYRALWNKARIRGSRLQGDWPRETFEIAYAVSEQPVLHRFERGSLVGLAVYVVPSYLEYYEQGNYDSFLINYLEQHELIGKTIFDLGGFVGVNSMQFAQLVGPSGRVYVFEPNPFNIDRLKLNLSENPDVHDRIRIFPLAVADELGKCKFNVHHNVDDGISSASYLDGAHTTLSDERLAEQGFTEVDVELTTLDQFVKDTGVSPACIKIDIEGSEHLALAGAVDVLRQHRPVLLIELHSIFCALATLEIIVPIGYRTELLHVEPDGRCFIGASYADTAMRSQPLSIGSSRLHAERRDLTAALVQCQGQYSAMCLQLNEQRAALVQCQEQYSTICLQLNEQRAITQVLHSHLNRYQMFFPIRVGRWIMRLFR